MEEKGTDASSNLSILSHWMETGMQQSPCTIALMLTHILGSGVKQLYGILTTLH